MVEDVIPILYEAAPFPPAAYKAGATETKPTCVGSIKRIFIKKWCKLLQTLNSIKPAIQLQIQFLPQLWNYSLIYRYEFLRQFV